MAVIYPHFLSTILEVQTVRLILPQHPEAQLTETWLFNCTSKVTPAKHLTIIAVEVDFLFA